MKNLLESCFQIMFNEIQKNWTQNVLWKNIGCKTLKKYRTQNFKSIWDMCIEKQQEEVCENVHQKSR